MKGFALVSLIIHSLVMAAAWLAVPSDSSPIERRMPTSVALQEISKPASPPPALKSKPLSADPINQPKPAPSNTPPVVGINAASTSEKSEDPGYAVGNTRMGQTSAVAADAVNQRAAILPEDPEFQAPIRMREVQAPYPAVYKAQELEANVIVSAAIDATGTVTHVQIIRPAKYSEFNEAALFAAKQTTYKPALYRGQPIAYTIQYSVLFRVTDE
jgi:TonB family protein